MKKIQKPKGKKTADDDHGKLKGFMMTFSSALSTF
jgi:hypothetical protein